MGIPVATIGPPFLPVEAFLAACRSCESRGYDAILWADHLMGMPDALWTTEVTPAAAFAESPHTFYDTVACIAAAGVHTERIRLGTGVTEAIRRHPAMLAQEWLTLDHLTRGRSILGIGSGEPENLTPYGLPFSRPVSRLEEALEVVRLLWENQGPVDYQGEFFQLREAACGLAPFEPGRYPPIWIAANGPRTLRMTGRLGDAWFPWYLTPTEYRERAEVVSKAASEAGRDPAALTYSLVHYCVMAEKPETSLALLRNPMLKYLVFLQPAATFEKAGLEHPMGPGWTGIRELLATEYTTNELCRLLDRVPDEYVQEVLFHGTPDDVVARVREYQDAGLDHVTLMDVTAMADPARAVESAALLDAVVVQLGSDA
jgi:phthiodiolone/phenolphthiodiolone dimycocerosates ketoreductase